MGLFINQLLFSQEITQTIRGTVVDKESKITLVGASVYLSDVDPAIGTITDENGNFRIENAETGRRKLCVSYLGYKPLCFDNLLLTSGKEIVLNIEIEEDITNLDEVVVKANQNKSKPLNAMSGISSRTFSIEETQRYAGARNDVARMSLNYAGVAAGNDATNEIIIRGNSSNGLLWQLEGVEISNPNHFGFMGATGGPVGMLNNNTLSNSDFITGAFAAEYGNALSGVFDLRMRQGNTDKHEFLGQVGLNGFELGAEGPIIKKHNSSYLINYRYSTLGLFHLLGINFGTGVAVPEYQDVSFKVVSDLGKGKLSLFGLAGISAIDFLYSERDSDDMESLYENEGFDIYSKNRQGVIGIKYFHRLSDKTYANLTLSADALQNKNRLDTVFSEPVRTQLFSLSDFNNQNFAANLMLNSKLNNRLTLRFGGEIRKIDYSLRDSAFLGKYNTFFNVYDEHGSTYLLRGYTEGNLKISDKLSLNGGVHIISLMLNDELNVEPRLGLKYQPLKNHTISLGYGNHSKMLPLFVYFRRVDINSTEYIQPNKDLEMVKSNHFVAVWDWQINSITRIKAEGYIQQIYNAVIEENPSSFSIINNNSFQFAIPDTLVNGGTGTNKGVELTIEQFMNKGFYYLVTASVFDSKYKGSDKIERSTAFDGGYVLNILGGREFKLKAGSSMKNYITTDVKLTAAGGQRYTPIDLLKSDAENKAVYIEEQAYSKKFKDYFRMDLRVAYRMDTPKFSHEFAFDVQNITNNANPLFLQYNTSKNETDIIYQLRIFPMMQYRITF